MICSNFLIKLLLRVNSVIVSFQDNSQTLNFYDTCTCHIRPLPPIVKQTIYFYHIGNVADQRKQFNKILEAFVRMNNPDTHLLVKATCNQPVQINIPRVTVINQLLSDEDMDKIHAEGDCYVAFSHSEGIGMGAVEAALHNKPVILPEYGAAGEYIKSDYTIKCGMTTLPNDDFLFQKGMEWGDPDFSQLQEFMQDAYDKRLRHMDHSHTKELLNPDKIENNLSLPFHEIISEENNDTN